MANVSALSDAQLMALVNGTPQGPLSHPGQNLDAFNPQFDLTKATDAQLHRYVADTNPNMSTAEDVARSTGGGLIRGAAGVASMPRGIVDTGQAIAQGGVDFLARHGVVPPGTKVPSI